MYAKNNHGSALTQIRCLIHDYEILIERGSQSGCKLINAPLFICFGAQKGSRPLKHSPPFGDNQNCTTFSGTN
jgi:hypothetical protein